MKQEDLQKILKKHKLWIEDNSKGKRADLKGADLRNANFRNADLRRAILRGADLRRADFKNADLEDANLIGADLSWTHLEKADLRNANFRNADLRWSNLSWADLRRADLSWTHLKGANFRNAYLKGAILYNTIGLDYDISTPLASILNSQVGKIRAYKLTDSNGKGPYFPRIVYKVGKIIKEDNCDNDINISCGKGISLATLNWILLNWDYGNRIFLCEFIKKDIVAVPVSTDGKFRVSKCKVIKEIDPMQFEYCRILIERKIQNETTTKKSERI